MSAFLAALGVLVGYVLGRYLAAADGVQAARGVASAAQAHGERQAALQRELQAHGERQAALQRELERDVARLCAEAQARQEQMERFRRALWATYKIAVDDLLGPPEPPAAGADKGSASAEAA